MTLRIQFLLGLTVLFTILMAGLFYERVQSTKQYAEDQLSSTAQDAASSLAYPVARAISKDDTVLAETVIKALLDRGYYKRIEIVSVRGTILAKLEQSKPIEGVPNWFVEQMPLNLTPGSALISDGWRQMGRVVVTSEPALAYKQLWQSLTQTALILGLIYLASLGAMFFLVRQLLQPLSAIEKSAIQVQDREFNLITDVPFTREFRRVVDAFNVMIERVKQFLAIEQQRAEDFRRQAFSDATSGLENRRSLDLQLERILNNHPKGSHGNAIGIQLADLVDFNNKEGYQRGDALISEFAQTLQTYYGVDAAILARLNGTTLFGLRYDLNPDELEEQLDNLLTALRGINLNLPRPIHYGVAVLDFTQSINKSRLLGELDLAMQQALYSGGDHFQRSTIDLNVTGYPSGAQEWREVLENAIQHKAWGLQLQTVQRINDHSIFHHEITARLLSADGHWIKAALFVPMAARHGLLENAERSLFSVVIDKLNSANSLAGQTIALNIGLLGALGTTDGMDIFSRHLTQMKPYSARVAFEVPEHQLVAHPELAQRLAKMLKEHGIQLGIDHFGFSAAAASFMQALRPNYVKIDRRLINDMTEHDDTRQMIASLIEVAHSLNITTIAQGVESAQQWENLKSMHIKAAQGYYIGKPTDLLD